MMASVFSYDKCLWEWHAFAGVPILSVGVASGGRSGPVLTDVIDDGFDMKNGFDMENGFEIKDRFVMKDRFDIESGFDMEDKFDMENEFGIDDRF